MSNSFRRCPPFQMVDPYVLSTKRAVDEIVVVNAFKYPFEKAFNAELVVAFGVDFLLDDVEANGAAWRFHNFLSKLR